MFMKTAVKKCEAGGEGLAMKKILVPLDFSEYSKKALAYAVAFARQFGAKLVLITFSAGTCSVLFSRRFSKTIKSAFRKICI